MIRPYTGRQGTLDDDSSSSSLRQDATCQASAAVVLCSTESGGLLLLRIARPAPPTSPTFTSLALVDHTDSDDLTRLTPDNNSLRPAIAVTCHACLQLCIFLFR